MPRGLAKQPRALLKRSLNGSVAKRWTAKSRHTSSVSRPDSRELTQAKKDEVSLADVGAGRLRRQSLIERRIELLSLLVDPGVWRHGYLSNGRQNLRSNTRDKVDDRLRRGVVTKDLDIIAVFSVINEAVGQQLIYGIFQLALLQNGRIRRHRYNQHR